MCITYIRVFNIGVHNIRAYNVGVYTSLDPSPSLKRWDPNARSMFMKKFQLFRGARCTAMRLAFQSCGKPDGQHDGADAKSEKTRSLTCGAVSTPWRDVRFASGKLNQRMITHIKYIQAANE